MSTKRQFLLGIFFLTALSILGFYTLFLTDFTLFKDPIRMVAYFPEAHDLREGDPVTVSGLRIGRVKELEFDPAAAADRRIRVTLHLNEPIEMLEGARIRIRESTLLGGRKVDIDPGLAGAPPLEQPLPGAYLGDVAPNPIASLEPVGEILAENRQAIASIVEDVRTIVADAREGRGALGRFLRDEEMAADFAQSTANLRQLTEDAATLTSELREGEGLLGALIYDSEIEARVRSAFEGLGEIIDAARTGDGLFARLIYDEAMAEELATTLRRLGEIPARLERGEGVLGMLLTDEEAAENARATLANASEASADLREVTAAVRRGEGTIGRLLHEEALYEEALTSLKLLTRSLEDFREAAPVTAFTGVLFSAF